MILKKNRLIEDNKRQRKDTPNYPIILSKACLLLGP